MVSQSPAAVKGGTTVAQGYTLFGRRRPSGRDAGIDLLEVGFAEP
jgi:hypothetical protein